MHKSSGARPVSGPCPAVQGELGAWLQRLKGGQGRCKKGVSRAKRPGSPCGWLSEKSKSIESHTIQGHAQSSQKNRVAYRSAGHGVRCESRPAQTPNDGSAFCLGRTQQRLIIFLLGIKVNFFIISGLKRSLQHCGDARNGLCTSKNMAQGVAVDK